MSEPDWWVLCRGSPEVGPSAGEALVVGVGGRQEELCWSPWQEDS